MFRDLPKRKGNILFINKQTSMILCMHIFEISRYILLEFASSAFKRMEA